MLIVSGMWQLFDALGITLSEALRAAGDTTWCMVLGDSPGWKRANSDAFICELPSVAGDCPGLPVRFRKVEILTYYPSAGILNSWVLGYERRATDARKLVGQDLPMS